MKLSQLKSKLNSLRRKKLFTKSSHIRRLVENYRSKARHNLETANILWKISDQKDVKKAMEIGWGYYAYDWVIVSAYYAMYHSALAALAKIGYKSDSHNATILALEYYFVHRKAILERKYIRKLREARQLEEDYIERFRSAKRRRVAAQYNVEISFSKEEAHKIIDDAIDFLDRLERVLIEIKEK